MYGEIAQGCLWTEYGAGTPLKSLRHMENWLNQRLGLSSLQLSQISPEPIKLSFSHMDIARRNVILTDENETCSISWVYAEFYPRYFQKFCIEWCLVDDDCYIRGLLHYLPGSYSNNEYHRLGEVLRVNSTYPPPVYSTS